MYQVYKADLEYGFAIIGEYETLLDAVTAAVLYYNNLKAGSSVFNTFVKKDRDYIAFYDFDGWYFN